MPNKLTRCQLVIPWLLWTSEKRWSQVNLVRSALNSLYHRAIPGSDSLEKNTLILGESSNLVCSIGTCHIKYERWSFLTPTDLSNVMPQPSILLCGIEISNPETRT